MSSNNEINSKQIELYNVAVEKYGSSSKSYYCDDLQRNYLRFNELLKFIDLDDPNKKILDVGCGNGELFKFLNFSGFRGKYIGCDINQMLLDQAQSRFENIDVRKVDIQSDTTLLKDGFDYVLLSGVFNLNTGQTSEWVYDFLRSMYNLCDGIMSFNALSTYNNFEDGHMFYMDPGDMLSFCIKNLSKRTTLAHHNLPYNYTVTCFKDQSWDSILDKS